VNWTLGIQDDFYRLSSDHRIRGVIEEVVRQERPVSLQLAARSVAAHWGFQQASEKLRERVKQLLPEDEVRAYPSGSNVFLWPVGTNPDTYKNFRVAILAPNRSEMPRTCPLRRLRTLRSSFCDSTLVLPKGSLHAKRGVSLDSSVRAGGLRGA
jgi:hypothetical protein